MIIAWGFIVPNRVPLTTDTDITPHANAVPAEHRFTPTTYRGQVWDLSHLDAFAVKVELSDQLGAVDVVVLFGWHCFTRGLEPGQTFQGVSLGDIYWLDGQRRILCPERYGLSKQLRAIVRELPSRQIRMAERQNYFLVEDAATDGGGTVEYAIFFELSRDGKRRRLFLRIQTAYTGLRLTSRLRDAKKVRFNTLVKSVFERKPLRA